MKKVILLLTVVIAALAFTACAAQKKPVEESKTVVDRSGNTITVPYGTDKIISVNAAATDILIGLGAGDKIIGADYYSRATLAASGFNTENIIEYDMMNPDAELIMSQRPDIVFATHMSLVSDPDVFIPLTSSNTAVAVFPDSPSIKDIIEDILFISDFINMPDEGEAMVAEMTAVIDEIAAIGAGITDKKTVYFEISAAPYLYSFGTGVFLNDFIELIGAVNVFADREAWIPATEETVLMKNPDVILTYVNYIENSVAEIMNRGGWNVVTAVKNGDVYYIDNDASSRASQNVVKAIQEMAKAIYPDKY